MNEKIPMDDSLLFISDKFVGSYENSMHKAITLIKSNSVVHTTRKISKYSVYLFFISYIVHLFDLVEFPELPYILVGTAGFSMCMSIIFLSYISVSGVSWKTNLHIFSNLSTIKKLLITGMSGIVAITGVFVVVQLSMNSQTEIYSTLGFFFVGVGIVLTYPVDILMSVDRTTRKLITTGTIPENIFVIDSNSEVYQVDSVYPNSKNQVQKTGDFIPEISVEDLDPNEELILWEEYQEEVGVEESGQMMLSVFQVETHGDSAAKQGYTKDVISEENQEVLITARKQAGSNPMALSAEALETLKQEDLLEEYQEQFNSDK
jgi:4-amino-4-deoxy-L-arabinose transferase-like glycosyltransferase